ncbi:MAG: oxygen-independent coproporphyrinogen III oxidase [Pseudomonadota bacterium]
MHRYAYTKGMENEAILAKYGLFRAKVPRFTSYPPANRFELNTGRRYQDAWLEGVAEDAPISLYVHIPFCRRLCYFCACRTQGTRTLKPVAAYVETLIKEIRHIRQRLPKRVRMARLHFGGGTPTLLDEGLMNLLCDTIFNAFATSQDFEFSVEIDPTEAAPGILETLVDWKMGRASIGVQDFAPDVQAAIGRLQSFDQTEAVVNRLRALGVQSINLDLVYGLPHQTTRGLDATLDHVLTLRPDRLALYGYAHVPQVSKRQVMISDESLPVARQRFYLASDAREKFLSSGFMPIGIDHFARESDSLASAACGGTLRRNFQGYTDDPCHTLIGFGASAISEFPEGYVQNAVATAAYTDRVRTQGLAGHRGYAMKPLDRMVSDLVQGLMCRSTLNVAELKSRHPDYAARIDGIVTRLANTYGDALEATPKELRIRPDAASLTRVIASAAASEETTSGSLAI